MEITLRIAQPTDAPTAPAEVAVVPPQPAPVAAATPVPAYVARESASTAHDSPPGAPSTGNFHSSLAAAIGRLQVKFGPKAPAGAPVAPIAAPVAPMAPAASEPNRPVLSLGSIPLAKTKTRKKPEPPADQQVIPLVLPEFIDPQDVRGRVPQPAEAIEPETIPAAAPQPVTVAAPVPVEPPPPAPAAVPPVTPIVPAVESISPAVTPPTAETALPASDATPLAPAKQLVRPGPDPVIPKPGANDAPPEETVEQRIARIKNEDEELRNDERRLLKIANDVGQLSSMVEVILFQNAKPLTINQIARALPGKVNPKLLRQSLQLVADRFDRGEHPIELVEIAGGWQLVVRTGFQELIESFSNASRKRTLTGSIMETLAIIAYRQGTTKVEIETLRGINDCGPHLRQLIEMGLVSSGRRTDLPGQPMGYWTAPLFMRAVGIRSLDELGKMGEFTPTEVAGLVEMEAPPPPQLEDPPSPGDATVDADAIDAAMSSPAPADAAAGTSAEEEEEAAPPGELFGDAVVIPVDPADTAGGMTPTSGTATPAPAGSPAAVGKAKRTRKRKDPI